MIGSASGRGSGVSVLVARPAPSRKPPRPARRGRTAAVVAGVAILLLTVVGQHAWTSWRHRSSYPPEAVHASASFTVLSPRQAQAKVDELAGPGRMSVPLRSRQEVVGQLTFTVPPNASPDDQYALFVIDNRLNQPVPDMWGVGPVGTSVGQGWDGRYGQVARKYSWLAGLAPVPLGDGNWTDPGTAVSFRGTTTSPVTFVAVLSPDAPPVTDPRSDLSIALVLLGHNGSIWAQNLTVG